MYMENDKLVIPDYIKNMSLEEIQVVKEHLYQKHLEEKEKKMKEEIKLVLPTAEEYRENAMKEVKYE